MVRFLVAEEAGACSGRMIGEEVKEMGGEMGAKVVKLTTDCLAAAASGAPTGGAEDGKAGGGCEERFWLWWCTVWSLLPSGGFLSGFMVPDCSGLAVYAVWREMVCG